MTTWKIRRVTDPAEAERLGPVLDADRDCGRDLVAITTRSIAGTRPSAPGSWAVWAAHDQLGAVVGMAEAWDAATAIQVGADPYTPEEMVGDPKASVGSLTRIAVPPDLQHRGIGTALTAVRLTWLLEAGCSHAVAEATIPRGDDTVHQIAPIHRRFGFVPVDGTRRASPLACCRHCLGRDGCSCETVMLAGPLHP